MKFSGFSLLFSVLVLTLTSSGYAAKPHPEVGSPHYILEHTSTRASEPVTFTLWEIRPSERTQNPLSGSRVIAQGGGYQVAQFGLSDYSISKEGIRVGTAWVLSDQGDLRHGIGKSWTVAATEVATMTSGAEADLHAITRDGQILELSSGRARQIGKLSEFVAGPVIRGSLHRSRWDSALELLDQAGTLHRYDLATRKWTQQWLQARMRTATSAGASAWQVSPSLTWSISGQTVELLNHGSNEGQGFKLQTLSVDEPVTEVLSADASALVVRVGPHIWKVTPTVFGGRLSLSLLAADFYSADLRSYGVTSGLFRDILAVRPADYDKVTIRRNDIQVASYRNESLQNTRPTALVIGDVHVGKTAALMRQFDEGHRAPVTLRALFHAAPLNQMGTHKRLNNHPESPDSQRRCSEQLLPPNND